MPRAAFGQRPVRAADVVGHEEDRLRVFVILQLLREAVGQPGEAAHVHADREIRPLDVGRGDMPGIGTAHDPLFGGRDALGRGVPPRRQPSARKLGRSKLTHCRTRGQMDATVRPRYAQERPWRKG